MADEGQSRETEPVVETRAAGEDTFMRVIDQPYVVGLVVSDDKGNTATIDNSEEGALVPAALVQPMYQAAFDAKILIEEVST